MADGQNRWRGEVWVPLAYLVLGGAWIAISGALARRLAGDVGGLGRIEGVKG